MVQGGAREGGTRLLRSYASISVTMKKVENALAGVCIGYFTLLKERII